MENDVQANELLEIIGENVKTRRLELGLSQQELADAVGVSQPFVAAIESRAKRPNIHHIARLAEALRTTPSAILTRDIFSAVPT